MEELKVVSANCTKGKAELILDCVQNGGDTIRDFQESRDFITQSLVRDLEHQKIELSKIDMEIEKMLATFDYKLTTMPYVGNAYAAKLIAEIGDIRRFPTSTSWPVLQA